MPETPEFLKVTVGSLEPLLKMDEVKAHLRVDDDDSDELIVLYANAAVQRCLDYCSLKLIPLGGETVFKVAALLVTGDYFENRGGEEAPLHSSAKALLEPHRVYRV